MNIKNNGIYFFTKSGNEVLAIEPCGSYLGKPMWVVERTRGTSAGKRMSVPACTLVVSVD